MSVAKYSNWGDIDTTAVDVYETEDVAYMGKDNDLYDSDDSLRKLSEIAASDGANKNRESKPGAGQVIDDRSLPPRTQAGKVFGRRSKGVGQGKDEIYTFRPKFPSIVTKSKGVSLSSGSESEDDQTSRPFPRLREDPVSKLRRLKLESLELQRQLENQAKLQGSVGIEHDHTENEDQSKKRSKSKPDTQVLLTQLLELRTGLDKMEGSSVLKRGAPLVDKQKADKRRVENERLVEGLGEGHDDQNAGSSDATAGQVAQPASSPPHASAEVVSDLDKRLNSLEKRIGLGVESGVSPVPILSSLSRMESLLSLLTQPNQLEAVSRRVKLLLADLDKTTASSKTAALKDDPLDNADGRENGQVKVNAKELERIDKLYTALPRLEPLLPLLPPLLTRLRSLSALHAGASTFQSTLAKVEGESATMRDTDEEMKEILSRLEAGMKGQADVMKNNWTGLADRLTQLESRLASL